MTEKLLEILTENIRSKGTYNRGNEGNYSQLRKNIKKFFFKKANIIQSENTHHPLSWAKV